MNLQTHLEIDTNLSGRVIELAKDYAKVRLVTSKEMLADKQGLIHGGFTFSAADFAAMAAVNEPNVVLTASECRFLAPVVLGDEVLFEARLQEAEGAKAKVFVEAFVSEKKVFEGVFKTYTPKEHILKK